MNNFKTLTCIAILAAFISFGLDVHAEATVDTLAWALQTGGTEEDQVNAVESFPDGSFAVTGVSKGPFYLSTPPEPDPYPPSVFVAKYDASRRLVWMRSVPASVAQENIAAPSIMDALPDGTIFIGLEFYGEITLGEGESNEITFSAPASPGALIAAFEPDGTLKWASAARHAQTGRFISPGSVSSSSDGTCYVHYLGSPNATLAVGTPEEVTMEGDNNLFLACYSNEGRLEWVKQYNTLCIPHVVALDDCCIVVYGEPLGITNYSRSGNVLWTGPAYSYYMASGIPGARSFIAYGHLEFARYNVSSNGTVTRQWLRPRPYNGHGCNIRKIRTWPDGRGIIHTIWGANDRSEFFVFASDGTLGQAMDFGLTTLNRCISPAPVFPTYYAAGFLGGPQTFGEGQPGEITFSMRGGPYDGYVALYGQEFGYRIHAGSVGRGGVVLNPSQSVYTPGTVVTASAQPTFPNHDRFVEWQGDLAAYTEPEVTFTVEGDMEFTAVFEEIPGAPPLPTVSLVGLAALGAALAAIGYVRRR